MKRHALLKHLQNNGCILFHEGKKHSIFLNPINKRTSSIPRHKEIVDKLALKICKDLGIPQIQ